MNKLHDALKNEELMLEVGRKATEEQKAMTQSTVEERFKNIFYREFEEVGIIAIDSTYSSVWDFWQSEIQLAEQKAREELKQTIIEKIEEYAKSQEDQHTEYAIMGCISLINEI